tara:strand:- start:179 stop:370 length:192 start_codon:yes stop_codon:yes gene_type:complete
MKHIIRWECPPEDLVGDLDKIKLDVHVAVTLKALNACFKESAKIELPERLLYRNIKKNSLIYA